MKTKKTNITLYIDENTKKRINEVSEKIGIKKGKLLELLFNNLDVEKEILKIINEKINK